MYELILHSQVAAPRQNQVLQILAGITAMQPVQITEQVLIYQQLKAAGTTTANKKKAANQTNSAPRLRYDKLVRHIEIPSSSGEWKLLREETPDAGVKDANARTVSEKAVSEDQMARFQSGSEWYR